MTDGVRARAVRALVDGRVVMYPSVDAMMADVNVRARVKHPERFAPDGTPLMGYAGRGWAERRATWDRRHGPEPEVVDDDATNVGGDGDAAPDVMVPVIDVDAAPGVDPAHGSPAYDMVIHEETPAPRHDPTDDIPF